MMVRAKGEAKAVRSIVVVASSYVSNRLCQAEGMDLDHKQEKITGRR